MTKAPYLLCYDIRCPKRLIKVHKIAGSYAMPVQYSVFYGEFDQAEVTALLDELEAVIDCRVDDVRLYAVTRLSEARSLGTKSTARGLTALLASGYVTGG